MKTFDEKIFESGEKLPMIDEFYSLQGEGYHTGKAAYFIRIGGCDIGCYWCDTKISWKADIHHAVDVGQIVEKAVTSLAKSVVVTGGEPTLYNLTPLCNALKKNNIKTFIETSGSYPLTGTWDWICLSPKQQNPPQKDIFAKAHELKVIILNESTFEWAEENAAKVSADSMLFLQPEWSKHKELTPRIVEYIKQNPKWNLSIQMHKYIQIP